MKIILDLEALRSAGRIDEQESLRLQSLASTTTRQLALNLLLFFGLAMFCAGAVWLVPEAQRGIAATAAGIVLAAAAALAGRTAPRLRSAASVLLHAGVVLAVFGILAAHSEGAGFGMMALQAMFAAAVAAVFALVASSTVLTVLAVLLANLSLFTFARYWSLPDIDPVTVLLIAAAVQSLAAGFLWRRLPAGIGRRMAAACAITAIVIVHISFADRSLTSPPDTDWPSLANNIHALLWTLLLAGGGYLAFVRGWRWAVNLTAVFAMIDFFGQWFQRFEASALSLFVAGAFLLAAAFAVHRFNSCPPPPVKQAGQ